MHDRLPKQALFAYLPADLGTARVPGKQGGKRLRNALVHGLQKWVFPSPAGCLLPN